MIVKQEKSSTSTTTLKNYNKKFNTLFVFLLTICCIFTILIGYYIISTGSSRRILLGFITSLLITFSIFLCLIKCSYKGKRRLLFTLYTFFIVEIVFQIIALMGLLPGIHKNFHVPFGRVYCVKEGFGNSIMNRYGWYYPEFKLKKESRKIVLIGDSMIEGIQVNRRKNIGVILENYIKKNNYDNLEIEVLSLGLSGTGPAHYLEMLKYAKQYFNPNEVIIFISLANDFRNAIYKVQHDVSPKNYIYYLLDNDGDLKIHPESISAQIYFYRKLKYNHRNFFLNIPKILGSQFMTPTILKKIINSFRKTFSDKTNKAQVVNNGKNIKKELQMLGLDDFIFGKNPSDDANEAIAKVTGLLKMCHLYTISQGLIFRIVTIPIFPPAFYINYQSNNWSWEIGDYDIFLPERILIDFAHNNKISILPMGKYMYDNGLSVNNIKELYLLGGTGHFSPLGHEYFARAIYSNFFANKK